MHNIIYYIKYYISMLVKLFWKRYIAPIYVIIVIGANIMNIIYTEITISTKLAKSILKIIPFARR